MVQPGKGFRSEQSGPDQEQHNRLFSSRQLNLGRYQRGDQQPDDDVLANSNHAITTFVFRLRQGWRSDLIRGGAFTTILAWFTRPILGVREIVPSSIVSPRPQMRNIPAALVITVSRTGLGGR